MRTMTERGVRWLLVAMVLALAANALLLALGLVVTFADMSYVSLDPILPLSWEALLFLAVVPAYFGFRALRASGGEFRDARAASGRRGTLAFILGATSAALWTATGLILGFVYVPSGAYANPPGAMPVALGEAIRGLHALAPAAIALFIGVFLLGESWSLASRGLRVLAGMAFVSGVAPPVVWPASFYLSFPAMTTEGALALEVLPVVSLALWIVVYFLVLQRLRGSAPAVVSTPIPA